MFLFVLLFFGFWVLNCFNSLRLQHGTDRSLRTLMPLPPPPPSRVTMSLEVAVCYPIHADVRNSNDVTYMFTQ